MRWILLVAIFSVSLTGLSAESWTVESWMNQADSLRRAGQDAASLDLLGSAQQHFIEKGDRCSAALVAERKSRIHLDWDNPSHADRALSEALRLSEACPELQMASLGWHFALAQAKLDQGSREAAKQELTMVAGFLEADDLPLKSQALAVEALARLAKMSFDEGDFEGSESDHLSWAAALLSLDRRSEAVETVGWAGICGALENPKEAPAYWRTFPDDAAWKTLSLEHRTTKGIEWGRILLGGGALEAFDEMTQWPWAQVLELSPGELTASLEAQWALLMARRWHNRPTQALAASLHAELAARSIALSEDRVPLLIEALRLRAELLSETGANGPAYRSLSEADSLSRSVLRAERARTGLFESEPWLAAIGDARTAIETQSAAQWRHMTFAVTACLVVLLMWLFQLRRRSSRAHQRLRRLQQQWLPGKQNQIDALAKSGARIVGMAKAQNLPGELQTELEAFGRLADLCSSETQHRPVDLNRLCGDLANSQLRSGSLDWTLQETVPFCGDQAQLRDFFNVLLEGVGNGGCRMAVQSSTEGLEVALDGFSERGWWRQAMSLFAGDGQASNWSLIRLRCDRLGGVLNLDCNAAGANRLLVKLPVYSA